VNKFNYFYHFRRVYLRHTNKHVFHHIKTARTS
jgi:hypothetical protein